MTQPDDGAAPLQPSTREGARDEAAKSDSIQASIAQLVKQSQELLQAGGKLAEEVEAMRQASDERRQQKPPNENPDSQAE
jgi:hypothetical protein